MPFDNLLLERDGPVAVVTVNRPRVLNALNSATLDELRRVMIELKADESVRAIVLTGAGEKSFVAGAVAERAGDEVRDADADVGDGGKADQPLRHVEREQPPLQRQAEREHQRQSDEEDESLRPPAEPQVPGAGHRPRRDTQQHEPA